MREEAEAASTACGWARLSVGQRRRLLGSVPQAAAAVLPGGSPPARCHEELCVLLWTLLDGNALFRDRVLRTDRAAELAKVLLYFMWDARQDPARAGLVHVCPVVLLLLSGERRVGIALNRPYARDLPLAGAPLFGGSLCDLLVVVLHKMVVAGRRALGNLYNCWLTVLANVSAYFKALGREAAMKLLDLLLFL